MKDKITSNLNKKKLLHQNKKIKNIKEPKKMLLQLQQQLQSQLSSFVNLGGGLKSRYSKKHSNNA